MKRLLPLMVFAALWASCATMSGADRVKFTPLAVAYGRMVEHLGNNQVDLTKTPLMLGAPLTLDPAAERFTRERAAHARVSTVVRSAAAGVTDPLVER